MRWPPEDWKERPRPGECEHGLFRRDCHACTKNQLTAALEALEEVKAERDALAARVLELEQHEPAASHN